MRDSGAPLWVENWCGERIYLVGTVGQYRVAMATRDGTPVDVVLKSAPVRLAQQEYFVRVPPSHTSHRVLEEHCFATLEEAIDFAHSHLPGHDAVACVALRVRHWPA